jgi:hypothetical protein
MGLWMLCLEVEVKGVVAVRVNGVERSELASMRVSVLRNGRWVLRGETADGRLMVLQGGAEDSYADLCAEVAARMLGNAVDVPWREAS